MATDALAIFLLRGLVRDCWEVGENVDVGNVAGGDTTVGDSFDFSSTVFGFFGAALAV